MRNLDCNAAKVSADLAKNEASVMFFQRHLRKDYLEKIRIYSKVLLCFVVFIVHSNKVIAVTITTTGNGSWSSTTPNAPWPSGTLPAIGDDIVIGNGFTLTVDGNRTCSSIAFTAPNSGTGSGTLTVNSGQVLNITTGLYTPGSNVDIKTNGSYIITGAGTIDCALLKVGNAQPPSGSGVTPITLSSTIASLNVTGNLTLESTVSGMKVNNSVFDLQSGNVTVGGSVTMVNPTGATSILSMSNGAQSGSLILTGTNPFSITGGGTTTTTFNGSTAKVTYSSSGAQTVRGAPSIYTNLTLSGSGSKSITTANVTVNGVLSMEGTATATAAPTYGTAATLQYNTTFDRSASAEWISPFTASGGVIIANTGEISLNTDKVFNTSIPLNINSGAKLNTSGSNSYALTFNGDFINNGTLTGNASNIMIAGGTTQSIGGFKTTGIVSMTKTAGVATATGNFEGSGLTIDGPGGTLNLGTSRIHTFSGNWTRTAGALNGGVNTTLQIGGSAAGTGGSTFTANTGTVTYYGSGGQSIAGVTYNILLVNNGMGTTNTALGTITATTLGTAGGGTLNMANFQLLGITSASGVAGTIRTQNTSSTPIPSGLNWGGVVQYDASTGGQTIVAGSYSSISSGGTSGTNTLVGDISVNKTLSIATGTTLAYGTGIARTITLTGVLVSGLSNNGTIDMSSGGGGLAHLLRIAASSLTNFGTLTNGSNSTVEYYGAVQTISSVSYNHLLLSGTGAKSLQASPMTIAGDLTSAGTVTVTANAAVTVNGTFTIGSSTSFDAGSFSHILKGNLVKNGTFTPSTSTVTMNGNAAQSISGSSSVTFHNLTINNTFSSLPSATITLGKAVNVNGGLTLTRGYIVSTSTNIVNMADGSTTSGTSANSYVVGPMTKTGTTAFEFPIGDATRWARIAIGAPSANSTFFAQYFSSPYTNSTLASSPTPVLVSVSSKEYWQLDRTVGTGTATVKLFWEDANWSAVTECSDTKLRVAHWNGSAWENNNDGAVITGSCTGTNAGTITTSTAVNAFSPFSFGVTLGAFPIELVSFTAKCQQHNVQLNWSTASELNNDYFLLLRSQDAIHWDQVSKIDGAGTSLDLNSYLTVDYEPFTGANYYRLQQTDYDGKFEYSNIVTVESCGLKTNVLNIYPNPSSGIFHLELQMDINEVKSIEIFDAFGKQVYKGNNYPIDIDLSDFPDGQYLVQIVSENELMFKRVIKNSL